MDIQAERFGQPVAASLGSIEAQIQLGFAIYRWERLDVWYL